jgi:hypothetical protein
MGEGDPKSCEGANLARPDSIQPPSTAAVATSSRFLYRYFVLKVSLYPFRFQAGFEGLEQSGEVRAY